MNNRELELHAYVRELEGRLLAAKRAAKEAKVRADIAEAEVTKLENTTNYVARSDGGRVLYEGTHEAAAITEARNHFWRTREHVVIDGSFWNTRQHGGTRRVRRG